MYTSTQSSTFCTDELHRALSEQSFGIQSFSITTSSPLQAAASVGLLDGRNIIIILTTSGYFIGHKKSDGTIHNPPYDKDDKLFETVENLLQSVSPLYERRRQELLIRRLEKLS